MPSIIYHNIYASWQKLVDIAEILPLSTTTPTFLYCCVLDSSAGQNCERSTAISPQAVHTRSLWVHSRFGGMSHRCTVAEAPVMGCWCISLCTMLALRPSTKKQGWPRVRIFYFCVLDSSAGQNCVWSTAIAPQAVHTQSLWVHSRILGMSHRYTVAEAAAMGCWCISLCTMLALRPSTKKTRLTSRARWTVCAISCREFYTYGFIHNFLNYLSELSTAARRILVWLTDKLSLLQPTYIARHISWSRSKFPEWDRSGCSVRYQLSNQKESPNNNEQISYQVYDWTLVLLSTQRCTWSVLCNRREDTDKVV